MEKKFTITAYNNCKKEEETFDVNLDMTRENIYYSIWSLFEGNGREDLFNKLFEHDYSSETPEEKLTDKELLKRLIWALNDSAIY